MQVKEIPSAAMIDLSITDLHCGFRVNEELDVNVPCRGPLREIDSPSDPREERQCEGMSLGRFANSIPR